MKILYWTGLFWPHIGGVEVLSMHFIPAMQERGHEFAVVTSRSNSLLEDKEIYKGTPVYRFPFHTGVTHNNLKEIKGIREEIIDLKKKFKPDLIHLNSIDASIFFHSITDLSENNIPTLFTVHSLPPYTVDKNTLLWKILSSAEWITTASEAMLTTVYNINAEISNRSSLIYYGLKMPLFEPKQLSFDTPRFLCLGRIVPEKGFNLALKAFVKVIKKFPSSRLVIGGDGPDKAELEQEANKLGLTNFVEFLGWVHPEKVPDLINTSTAVIIPSKWEEPFGLVALQAAQMARPVIAASVGGLPEIVEHKKTGLLFEKENIAKLAEYMCFLIEHQDEAKQMGKSAQIKVLNQFGFEDYINAYDELYKKLVNSKTSKVQHI